jgi:hypothetical protein
MSWRARWVNPEEGLTTRELRKDLVLKQASRLEDRKAEQLI